MTNTFLVSPLAERALRRAAGRSVVVEVEDAAGIARACRLAGDIGFHIHCLLWRTAAPLAYVPLDPGWRDLPIALSTPTVGPIAVVCGALATLRALNIRVYLPADRAENIAGARVLSSLGIETALDLLEGDVDWERVSDLMVYALMGIRPHAPIAPFNYLADRFDPFRRTDYGVAYFADPASYVYLAEDGRVALSAADRATGRFVLDDVAALDTLPSVPAYRDRLNAWRSFFLKADGCAYCEGWRICLGKFAPRSTEGRCAAFFSEFLDTVERTREQRRQRGGRMIWQP